MLNNELYHYGVKGMKWGVRRYQNPDGTLTSAGKKREAKRLASDFYRQTKIDGQQRNAIINLSKSSTVAKLYDDADLRAARDRVKNSSKLRENYYSNSKLLDTYQRKYAEELSKNTGYSSKETIKWIKSDDRSAQADRGYNSFDAYLRYTGKGSAYRKEVHEAYQNLAKVRRKTVDNYLGKYGNTPVKMAYRLRSDTKKKVDSLAETMDRALAIYSYDREYD